MFLVQSLYSERQKLRNVTAMHISAIHCDTHITSKKLDTT